MFKADVSVEITATTSSVWAGTAVTYTLTISNNGPQLASFIRLTNTLPSQASLIGSPPPTCTGTTTLACELGSMPENGMTVFSYAVLLPITATGFLTNSAIITAVTVDNNLANNTAVHTIPILVPPSVHFAQNRLWFIANPTRQHSSP